MKYPVLFVLCLALLFIVNINAVAQERYAAPKVILPSPTAAALGKYGEFPIGYYSGTADISIPLYEVKGKLPLDIKLQYNSTGVKVGENASWVGLGWSLLAGGVITRSIRGQDDFSNSNGYYYADALPPDNYTTSDYPYFKRIFDNYMDGEPDAINYNFAGYSGRFVMGKMNDGSLVYMDERNNLKVENLLYYGWRITDANGIKYCFNTKEATQDYFFPASTQEVSDNATLNDFQLSTQPSGPTAWYLDSIIAPGVDTILFSYSRNSAQLSPINKSVKVHDQLDLMADCYVPNAKYITYSANRQVITDANLQRITFKEGTIDFNTSERQDLEYVGTAKPVKLSEIIVKNSANRVIKSYQLFQSYFTYSRLRLDSVIEKGGVGVEKLPYKFTYYDGVLPFKYSKGIDKWGYDNKKANNTLVPAMTVFPETLDPKFLEGADREPNTNVEERKAGVLSSITYPTGGQTKFDYELNTYANLYGEDRFQRQYNAVRATSGELAPPNQSTKNITLTDTTTVRISFSHMKTDPNGPDLMNENLQAIYAYLYQGVNTIASYSNWDEYQPYYDLVLFPGNYTLYARPIQGYITRVDISYNTKTPVAEKTGGGLRIKSITNYEAGKKASVRKFLYTDGSKNSGVMITTPLFSYTLAFTSNIDMSNGQLTCLYTTKYLTRESSSMFVGTGSCIVGYSKVTELLGENGENGKTEYFFNNKEDITTYPYIPPYHNNLNGKIREKRVYDATGMLQRKTNFDYKLNESYQLRGVKIYAFDPMPNVVYTPAIRFEIYKNNSEWYVLSKETDTLYDKNNSFIATTKRSTYSNSAHKEITRLEVDKSDGGLMVSKYKYPDDYPLAAATSFPGEMRKRYMISALIEEQTLSGAANNLKLVSGKFTSYKGLSNNTYVPSTVYMLNAATPLVDTTASTIIGTNAPVLHPAYAAEAYFDVYDNNGNITAFHKNNNVPIAYLWSYDGRLPIAQVENASPADIAYTSFEAESNGNWTVASSARVLTSSLTGDKSYSLSAGNITASGLNSSKTYLVSYWSNNGAYTVSGQVVKPVVTGKSAKGYVYYQHQIKPPANGIVTVSGSGGIDELRLYPLDARMQTYTYIPLVGISSQCDQLNQLMFYEFDDKGRLKIIRDMDGKIVKMFCYNYYGQPENCN